MDGSILGFLKCTDGSIWVSLKCMDGSVLAHLRFPSIHLRFPSPLDFHSQGISVYHMHMHMSGNSQGVKRHYLGHKIIICNTLL